jgi:hypothetical protein
LLTTEDLQVSGASEELQGLYAFSALKHVRQMMNFTNQGKARNKTTRIAASQTNHFAVRVDAGEQTPSTQSTGAGR